MPDGVHQVTSEPGDGAQLSSAGEDDDAEVGSDDEEEDEEENDAYNDDKTDSEWVIDLPESETQANSKKFIWSMHHTMRTDLRRRFTFGITFADTAKKQYRITVGGEPYITVETLANQGAEHGFGSCTRVFRAYRESDKLIDAKDRRYYAVKDNWLERGRRTEFEIYEDIMRRIGAHDWQGLYDVAPATPTDYP
ncbi:hypothetical protein C2E23DRAFT_889275 [Lenzites betulinus]|nr:hypothetical protein C2E23DRAFT_889275 [Lenzites betulinus]